MRKLISIAALLSAPALAHQTPFDKPEFLKLTGGDAKAAQELSWYCEGSKLSTGECIKDLQGTGNLKQEAARKCLNDSIAALPVIPIKFNNKEVPGSRAHKAEGVQWHGTYVRSPETGRLHRHQYSEAQKKYAYQAKLTMELVAARQRMDSLLGTQTTSTSVGFETSATTGLSEIITSAIDYLTAWTQEATKGLPLPDGEVEAAKRLALEAMDDPSRLGMEPEILCYIDERDCTVGSGAKVTNESYDPDYKEAEKNKKDYSKGASNPPTPHDEDSHNLPEDKITHPGGDKWAGDDQPKNPNTAIATPVLDTDSAAKTGMEKCVTNESKRLTDEMGRKSFDPNASTGDKVEKSRADSLLKHGYCDVQVMGLEFCRAKKFKEDSVVAVEIQEARKEAAASALATLKTTGQCDAVALGVEFCRKQRDKWKVNPNEKTSDTVGPRPKPRPGMLPRIDP